MHVFNLVTECNVSPPVFFCDRPFFGMPDSPFDILYVNIIIITHCVFSKFTALEGLRFEVKGSGFNASIYSQTTSLIPGFALQQSKLKGSIRMFHQAFYSEGMATIVLN